MVELCVVKCYLRDVIIFDEVISLHFLCLQAGLRLKFGKVWRLILNMWTFLREGVCKDCTLVRLNIPKWQFNIQISQLDRRFVLQMLASEADINSSYIRRAGCL